MAGATVSPLLEGGELTWVLPQLSHDSLGVAAFQLAKHVLAMPAGGRAMLILPPRSCKTTVACMLTNSLNRGVLAEDYQCWKLLVETPSQIRDIRVRNNAPAERLLVHQDSILRGFTGAIADTQTNPMTWVREGRISPGTSIVWITDEPLETLQHLSILARDLRDGTRLKKADPQQMLLRRIHQARDYRGYVPLGAFSSLASPGAVP